jgi:ATP-binding cassette subfamily B multidrug efflux pump
LNLWNILVRNIKPYWKTLIAILVFQAAQATASLSLPTMNADIIDKGVATGDIGYIWTSGGQMLLVSLGQIASSILATYFGARLSMAVGRDLRSGVFNQVGIFSERDLAVFGAPSLITRNTNDVLQIQTLVFMGSTMMLSAPILAVGGVIMALRIDLNLSIIMAISVPVLLALIGLLLSKMIPLFRLMQTRIDRINQVLREQLTGIRVVRAFVRESSETQRFARANDEVTDTALRSGQIQALMFPIVQIVLNLSYVAVLWLGAYQVDAGKMQIGTVMSFLQYMMQILIAVMMSMFMAMMIPRSTVSADRIHEVMNVVPGVATSSNPVKILEPLGSVRFEGVSFSYPGAERAVLEDLSFTVPSGSTTAIIGSTGSGKTTLINLIARLADPSTGNVFIDEVSAKDLEPLELWSLIGLIPQKGYLFTGTIASNLRYGREEATDEELWAALEIAQAASFVKAIPEQLNSPVVQGGTNFSGGQRQRLAIARALVKQPEILIFDDSFSALDLTTDAKLRQALTTQLPQTTKIIVGQRIASIKHADEIIVLEDGRVAGVGTHAQLLAENATYREIVESQLSAEEAA